jgi:hypothetical protein
MFTLSQEWRRRLGVSPSKRQGSRSSTTRPWLEVLEDRAVPSTVTTPPASTGGPTGNSAPTSNALLLAPQTPAQTTVQQGVGAIFFTPPAALRNATNLSPSTAGLGQNQSGQSGLSPAPDVFPFFPTNDVLGTGVASPGVPFGFTGRIAFSNTGTPERTANGVGALAPNSGVTPTGLYLTSGGGDNGMIGPPPRPAPAPALPGMALLEDLPLLTPTEEALLSLDLKP